MDTRAVALEIGVLALATLVLLWDLGVRRPGASHVRGVATVTVIGLLAILGVSFTLPDTSSFTAAWTQDAFALFVKQVLLAAAALTVLAMTPYASRHGWADRCGDAIVLLLFATVGGMALVSARELLTLFVAFELLSIPLYALTAIEKRGATIPEGALKLFLFGSISSALLVLGISLVLAATGTTFWGEVGTVEAHPLLQLGLLLIIAGFGFKVAMVPFAMWVPDTYQAAPTPIVAFLSVAPKAAAVAALFRLWFEAAERWSPDMRNWLAVLAAATMIVGNLLALPQTDLKRLLAYSGIAHIGYILTALAAGTRLAAQMALFYFVAYLFSNVGAFLCVAAVEATGAPPTLAGVRDLGRRSPGVAAAFLVFLLSLGGIPFVIGFWGKLSVFLAAAQAGLWWLVLLGALLAVVALYYYLNVVRFMYIVHDDEPAFSVPSAVMAAVIVCAVVVTVGGLWPRVFVEPARIAVLGF